MTAPQATSSAPRDSFLPPFLWRLPLILFLLVGVACLRFLDGVLRREYRSQAVTQAVQTDALLESYLRQRLGLLHSIEVLMGAVGRASEGPRFGAFARDVFTSAPEMQYVAFLDSAQRVRAIYPDDTLRRRLVDKSAVLDAERALALARARSSGKAALTAPVTLVDGRLGMIAFDPVLEEGRLAGYVASAFPFQSIFDDALGGQLQGRFAYRVRGDGERVIAVSPDFPGEPVSLVSRAVTLPDGHEWQLDVAIPRFEPITARLILWGVGVLLLGLVVFLVFREEQRAERLGAHSFQLELLSRDLLDANLRLEERARQVSEANRAKSRFLANVSHELRTPLNAIVGYNSLVLDGVYGEMPAPVAAAHRRIAQAAEHLLRLVDDVLDLSKIEVGRMRADLQRVDLRALIDSVTTVIDPIAGAKGLHVDVVVARDVPAIVTDPQHLRQILLNLMSNAVKFTEQGSVTVVARCEDAARVRLEVHDTGIGIAAHDLARVFEEFEQVRPGGRGDSLVRGTGLGLAIVRKLGGVLGGEVTVESEVGVGSRFSLVLPIDGPATSTHESERAQPVVTTADGSRAAAGASSGAPAGRSDGASEGGRASLDATWRPEEPTPPEAQRAWSADAPSGLDDHPERG